MITSRLDKALAGVLAVSLVTFGTSLTSSARPLAPGGQAAASPKVSYTYDAGGRLLTVTNAKGMKSTYTYDADGNVTKISKPAAASPKQIGASRGVGPALALDSRRTSAHAGSELVLHGSHFSADPQLDKVNIGRLIAPVLRASSSSLTVRVPPGRGGPVTVLTPAGRAKNGRV